MIEPPSPAPSPILEFHELRIGYPGRPLTDPFSASLFPGEFTSIVGPNGSGKTTLMRTILGQLPPLSGSLRLHTHRGIGYLPQFSSLPPDFPATVLEIVLSGFAAHGFARPFFSRKERAAALDNLHTTGTDDLAQHAFQSLSGGQRQRVLLARALCATEDLLLLDEPMNNLDEASAEAVRSTLHRIHSQGKTILLITHALEYARTHSDRIIAMQRAPLSATREHFADLEPILCPCCHA